MLHHRMGDLEPLGSHCWGLGEWQLQPDPSGGWTALSASPTQPPLWGRSLQSLAWLVKQWERHIGHYQRRIEYAAQRRRADAQAPSIAAPVDVTTPDNVAEVVEALLTTQRRPVSERVQRILERRRQAKAAALAAS